MSRDGKTLEVAAWLTKARNDLRAAAADLGADPPLRDDAAFHCQQAVEKAIKGLLVRRGVLLDRTHDIRAIAGPLLRTDSDLEPLMRRAARLTAYSWRYRYPGEPFDPPAEEIAEAVATATEVVDTLEPRAMLSD